MRKSWRVWCRWDGGLEGGGWYYINWRKVENNNNGLLKRMHLLEHPVNLCCTLQVDLHSIMTLFIEYFQVCVACQELIALFIPFSYWLRTWKPGANQSPSCPPLGLVDLWMCVAALCYFSSCAWNILAQHLVKDEIFVSLVSRIISLHFPF